MSFSFESFLVADTVHVDGPKDSLHLIASLLDCSCSD